MSTFGQKLLVVLAFTVSMTSAGLPEDEIGLDTNDFANGEKIDLENEIPLGEDPLNDAMSGNGFEGDIDLTPEEKKGSRKWKRGRTNRNEASSSEQTLAKSWRLHPGSIHNQSQRI